MKIHKLKSSDLEMYIRNRFLFYFDKRFVTA